MEDAADHATIIHSWLASHVLRQMRLNLPPLFIVQPKQVAPHCPRSESTVDSESATDSAGNDFIGFRP
jgi:hypothetical protein